MTAPTERCAARLAYEEDCRRRPTYDDGSPRKAWVDLAPVCRLTWERNPTPRPWRILTVVAPDGFDAELEALRVLAGCGLSDPRLPAEDR